MLEDLIKEADSIKSKFCSSNNKLSELHDDAMALKESIYQKYRAMAEKEIQDDFTIQELEGKIDIWRDITNKARNAMMAAKQKVEDYIQNLRGQNNAPKS